MPSIEHNVQIDQLDKIDEIMTRQIKNITVAMVVVYTARTLGWSLNSLINRAIDIKVLPYPPYRA